MQSYAFSLWRRLIERFKLEYTGLGNVPHPSVGTEIQMTTDVDALLREPRGVSNTEAATAAQATVRVTNTVPAGKRWYVYAINHARTSGDNTFSRVVLRDSSRGLDITISTFAAGTSNQERLEMPYPMDAGDTIGVLMDGAGVAASNIRGLLWVEEEDAF